MNNNNNNNEDLKKIREMMERNQYAEAKGCLYLIVFIIVMALIL